MRRLGSVLENEKPPWDSHIQADHQIPARIIDLVLLNKEKITCQLVDFTIPAKHSKGKESKKLDRYQDFAGELKSYGT